MDVKNNIVVATARDIADGVGALAKDVWGFVGHPSQWRPRIEAAKQRRQDVALASELNRNIRKQFIEAFNRSAQKKMTVGTHSVLRQYKKRNGYISALLRPYEKYSNWRLSAKFIGAAVFFRAARRALWPVMGAWGMIVPLAAFVGARMAVVYREAKNKQQEAQLARDGFIVPCTFEVKNSQVSILGREMTQDFTAGFPIMHQDSPEWVVAKYDAAEKTLAKPSVLHAAGFEALRAGAITWDDVAAVRAAFPDHPRREGCVYAFSLLYPGADIGQQIDSVRKLADEQAAPPEQSKDMSIRATFNRIARAKTEDLSLAAAALRALDPFCVAGKEAGGLSSLAGKVTRDDIRYLISLGDLGEAPGREQAAEIFRMANDARFATLSFREMVEVAIAPPQASAAFDELWKDREYRARFDFDFIRDVAFNMQGWGGTALKLTRHDYSKSLTTDDIRELAAPENEYWAPAYHRLRTAQPEAAAKLSHAELKDLVLQYGVKAEDVIASRVEPKLDVVCRIPRLATPSMMN